MISINRIALVSKSYPVCPGCLSAISPSGYCANCQRLANYYDHLLNRIVVPEPHNYVNWIVWASVLGFSALAWIGIFSFFSK